MAEYVSRAVVIVPALVGLYVARRVIRKLHDDYVHR